MNYFEDHIGDYAAATAHLSWDEDMAYTRLIRAYYHAERAIPKDQTYRLARASTPGQRKAVDTVIAEFFTLADDGYHQKRCDEEIARFQDKQEKARASADARWSHMRSTSERNANALPNALPNAMRTHTERNANGMLPVSSLQSPVSSLHLNTGGKGTRAPEQPATAPTAAPKSPPAAPSDPSPSLPKKFLKPEKTKLPPDFDISEKVRDWAGEQGYRNLEKHLEEFRRKCLGGGYEKDDWDGYFMTAIRDDWAKVRGNGREPPPEPKYVSPYPENSLEWWEDVARCWGVAPWNKTGTVEQYIAKVQAKMEKKHASH